MHLLVTRPEPDGSAMRRRLEKIGHTAVVVPLLTVEPAIGSPIDLDGLQGLIVTSRNALRALDPAAVDMPARLGKRPLFVVGPGTASLARDLGFANVVSGPASARDLVPVIIGLVRPQDGPLVHLSGDEIAFDLAGALAPLGFTVRRIEVYRSVTVEHLPVDLTEAICNGDLDGVILMSPRTARAFASLVKAAGLGPAAARLQYLCLSAAVADGLSDLSPPKVRIAGNPNLEELLALTGPLAPKSA